MRDAIFNRNILILNKRDMMVLAADLSSVCNIFSANLEECELDFFLYGLTWSVQIWKVNDRMLHAKFDQTCTTVF